MIDTSSSFISKGDIVTLSPEINSQTYSLYFNSKAFLQACDGLSYKFKHLSLEDNINLIYNYFGFSIEKIQYKRNNNAPDPVGIYRHDSFNQYGDLKVDRPNNIMTNGVDSTTNIVMDNSIRDDEFVNYINDFCGDIRSKGAKVFFNFSPCNELAIMSSKSVRDDFQNWIDTAFDCDRLTNVEDCIIDYRYFYDTNFHLNSSGAVYWTKLLINNLHNKTGIESSNKNDNYDNNDNTDYDIVIPPLDSPNDTIPDIDIIIPGIDDNDNKDDDIIVPPSIGGDDVIEPDDDKVVDFDSYNGEANNNYIDYFEYKLVGSSYQIVSVKDEYKNMKQDILPSIYNGKNITTIKSNAFYGCIDLEEIYIGLTYKIFEEKSFNGCISLKKIYLFQKDGNLIQPPSLGLLDGASKTVKIFILKDANYSSGYTWSNYNDYFMYFEREVND